MPDGADGRGAAAAAYLRVIRRHAVVIFAVALLGAAVAFALSRSKPDYRATAEVVVSPLPQEEQTLLGLGVLHESRDSVRAIETAAVLLRSPEAARRAARLVHVPADDLLERVKIEILGESNVLAVSATADAPQRAAEMANAFTASAIDAQGDRLSAKISRVLPALRARLSSLSEEETSATGLNERITALETLQASGADPTLALGREARVPTVQDGPSSWLILFLGGLAGLALGVLGALAREATSRRISDEPALLAVCPLPTLARVPLIRRLRGGAGPVSPADLPPTAREAFRTMVAQLERQRADRADNRVLLVTSPSEGDGKTTAVACIADALAEAGYSVAALDCDLRRPCLAPTLGVAPEDSLTALLGSKPGTVTEYLEPTSTPGLDVLAALPSDYSALQALHRNLHGLIPEVKAEYDWTILDTPALGEVSDALRLLGAADEVLLVCRLGNTDRSKLRIARDLLEHAGVTPVGMLVVGASSPPATGDYGQRRQAVAH
jgi:Mrp family chromosome partitioning ATPase/capsular polysaccharide biosynthesis protein